MTEFKERVDKLAGIIAKNLDSKKQIDELKAKQKEELEKLTKDLDYKDQLAKELDLKAMLMKSAKEQYKEDGEKKLYAGIGIRVGKSYDYSETKALTWAKDHNLCLKLDKKSFEAIIKTQEIDFVKVDSEVVTVTFPSVFKLED